MANTPAVTFEVAKVIRNLRGKLVQAEIADAARTSLKTVQRIHQGVHTHCVPDARAVLSAAMARQIRSSNESITEKAKRFGVSPRTISRVHAGEHVAIRG